MNHKTNDNRGKIIWIDDEIDSLKPHILFLEEKGYEITPSPNGRDGLEKLKANSFDLDSYRSVYARHRWNGNYY